MRKYVNSPCKSQEIPFFFIKFTDNRLLRPSKPGHRAVNVRGKNSKNMRTIFFIVLVLLIGACSSPEMSQNPGDDFSPTGYDSTLAEDVGADPYGMKSYVLAFLKRGPNRPSDPDSAAALQRAHLNNITRLANEGVLVLAGPFMDSGAVRGIYIFDVANLDSARALTQSDPAIQSGSLVMELHPWYGSAALVKLMDVHKSIARESI